jgi:hypothetical protein
MNIELEKKEPELMAELGEQEAVAMPANSDDSKQTETTKEIELSGRNCQNFTREQFLFVHHLLLFFYNWHWSDIPEIDEYIEKRNPNVKNYFQDRVYRSKDPDYNPTKELWNTYFNLDYKCRHAFWEFIDEKYIKEYSISGEVQWWNILELS